MSSNVLRETVFLGREEEVRAMSSNLESEPRPSNSGRAEIDHHKVLLEVADLMVHHRNLPELFAATAEQLGKVAAAEFTNFSLHDPARNVMRLHDALEGKDLARPPIEVPVMDSPGGLAWQTQQPLVVPDVNAETRFSPEMSQGQRNTVVLRLAPDDCGKTAGS